MTTWILALLLAAVALAPLAFVLLRGRWDGGAARGRREADLALYRAQIAELDRERTAGRLDEAAHRAAVVEVQRRLLAAVPAGEEGAPPSALAEAAPAPAASPAAAAEGRRTALVMLGALAVGLPALALAIYLPRGTPDMPSAPYRARAEAAAQDDALIEQLRARLAQLDPSGDSARQGYVLLGNAERSRGRLDAAAEAWRRALDTRFDPGLAADLAELELERGDGDAAAALLTHALAAHPTDPRLRFLAGLAEAQAGRTENARTAWRGLLADSPPDAPWRGLVERQLQALP